MKRKAVRVSPQMMVADSNLTQDSPEKDPKTTCPQCNKTLPLGVDPNSIKGDAECPVCKKRLSSKQKRVATLLARFIKFGT
jgi:transcription elongation factor Elf1